MASAAASSSGEQEGDKVAGVRPADTTNVYLLNAEETPRKNAGGEATTSRADSKKPSTDKEANKNIVSELKARLQEVYGCDIRHIMPREYRDDSHDRPSAHFVKTLAKLARVHDTVPMELADLRFKLFTSAKHRLSNVMEAEGVHFIIVSDMQYAIEVMQVVMADDGDEAKDGGRAKAGKKRSLDAIKYPSAKARKVAAEQTQAASASATVGNPEEGPTAASPTEGIDWQGPGSVAFKQKLIQILNDSTDFLIENRLEFINEVGIDLHGLAGDSDYATTEALRAALTKSGRGLILAIHQEFVHMKRGLARAGVMPYGGVSVFDEERESLLRFIEKNPIPLADGNHTIQVVKHFRLVRTPRSGA